MILLSDEDMFNETWQWNIQLNRAAYLFSYKTCLKTDILMMMMWCWYFCVRDLNWEGVSLIFFCWDDIFLFAMWTIIFVYEIKDIDTE